jgi:hypothetical protein
VASRSLGTLTLDLVAKIGGYTAGLDKAEKEAAKRAAAIEKVFDAAAIGVGAAFGAMVAAGVTAFAAIGKGIESAAKYQDLAEEIGSSAEEVASFAVAAATAGVSIESVAGASVKLTKSLVGVDDESKAAGAALAAIGINIEEFKRLDPASQYEAVGKALAGYADGAGKTAVATALFGKAGAEQLKVFKALEEQGGRMVILTQEQIESADRFADAQAKLRAEIGLYASAAATQFIAPTEALIKVLVQAAQDTGLLGAEATKLGQNTGVATFAENAIEKLAFVADAAQGVGVVFSRVGEFIGASAAAAQAKLTGDTQGLEAIRKAYDDSLNQTQFKSIREDYKKALADQKEFKRQSAAETRGFNPLAPVAFQGSTKKTGGGAKDDPTKKLLENELAAIKAAGEAAKDLLADRNKMLDLYNQQGLLSVKDYYDQLQGNLDEATAAQAKSYDDQIAALRKFQAAASKQTDVADAQGKINKLEEDKAKLYRQSGTAALESSIKQVQAQKAIKDAFDEVNAKVLEYQGNLRAAGEIRFDAANEKLITQAKAEQNEQVIKQIELLKQYTLAQADINKLQSQFSLAQGDLQIAEERITIARERGTMGEIESLKKSGEARKEAVAIMERQLAAFQAIDAAARSPEQAQAIERLKVQLEGLKATVDPLADKFNTLFADSAGSALSDFINGTKTAKEAFKSFTDSIFKELVNLAAKEVFKSFFGKGGSATGGNGLDIGGLLSSFFGGGSSGSKGSSGGGGFGSLFSMFGFASGGFTGVGAANDPAGIVHKGEYVLTAEQTKRIGVANLDRGNFGGGNVFNINVPESVNRNTGTQIAAEAQRKLAQGRRNT